MKIIGLPEYFKDYSIAYFEYSATGEGKTIEAEILYKDQIASIGADWEGFNVERIPCVINKVFDLTGEEYLDWNPEFKMYFFECFGFMAWTSFKSVCIKSQSILDLKMRMHYNLW